jgi:hypothetical protein
MRRLILTALAALVVLVPGGSAGSRAVPAFKHVIVIVFENKERSAVVGSAPTFDALGSKYARLAGYRGVTHPSLPNYLALVSGSTQGITSDCTDCRVSAPSLADSLERAKKTWKTYAEGLPSPGWTGPSSGRYAKKHNPFLYFNPVLANAARRNRVVPFGQVWRDLSHRKLPDFALLVPDMCNSTHDCPVQTGDAWLARVTKMLLGSPQLTNSVIFVIFDEGSTNVGGGGETAALALGPTVRPGSKYAPVLNHYGLLRTVEDAWGLRRLGESAGAKPITGIWK